MLQSSIQLPKTIITPEHASPLIAFNQAFEAIFSYAYHPRFQHIVILCIGCDRATGDALGPLIGTKINHLQNTKIHIFGTLKEPVHALNLQDTLGEINKLPNPFIIAIDASLGNHKDIGNIIIKAEGIQPGSGVGKQLPTVGHMSITGIVNVGGFMANAVLQCTSLYLVTKMSNTIGQGLHYYFSIAKPAITG